MAYRYSNICRALQDTLKCMPNKFILPFAQWLFLIVLLCSLIFATEKLVQHQQQLTHSEQLKQEFASAEPIRSLIESELNASLYQSVGLSAYIKANKGEVSAADLNLLLKDLVTQAPHIRNIGVAPNNQLLYLYPLQHNAKALGLYYPDLENQWPDIRNIIKQRQAKLVGPISLVQGGKAFIYRIPVFLADSNSYWGLISTVINIEPIWQLVAEHAAKKNVKVAIRPASMGQYATPAFFGDNSLFYDTSLLLGIELRGANWQLAVRTLNPPHDLTTITRVLGYAISTALVLLLFWLLYSKQQLRHRQQQLQHNLHYLQTVLDNLGEAVITADENGIMEQVNLSCYSIFGYVDAALSSMHWSTLLAEPSLAEQIMCTIAEQKTEYETLGQRYDGSTFSIAIRLKSIVLLQQPRQIIILRDLSEWHKTEQIKQQFIANVSQELRSPLTSITGALSLVVGGALGELAPAQERILQLAHNNSQQLSHLINDLIDMEQLTTQSMVFTIQPVLLMQVLEKCIASVKVSWQHKKQAFQLDCADSYSKVQVLADKQHLTEVMLHLLNNACKFSPAKSNIDVNVSVTANLARISVSDNGTGVQADFVPRLFDRFAQANSADSRAESGTGLGLAISKAMIHQMHGNIGYLPNQNQGSCFFIELHLHQPNEITS